MAYKLKKTMFLQEIREVTASWEMSTSREVSKCELPARRMFLKRQQDQLVDENGGRVMMRKGAGHNRSTIYIYHDSQNEWIK